jgi:hypothetical protein
MTHLQRIEAHLTDRPGLCDDCLASELEISKRQTVYRLCSTCSRIHRTDNGTCVCCGKAKIIRSLSNQTGLVAPLPRRTNQHPKLENGYLRETDLQQVFNKSVATSLGIEFKDYYGSLNFEGLLRLKEGYARIHDIITLKLTLALVDWITERFNLSPNGSAVLRHGINCTHPNASGFDLDSANPNIIGEVKGCIPVNRGATFGAAQLKSLTNDVLQMLGRPPRGKLEAALSKRSKIRRAKREEAHKFLALYDSPDVRSAANKWKQLLTKELGPQALQDLPASGDLSCNAVYLVYLKPSIPERLIAKED